MSRIEVKGVLSLDGSGWQRTIDQAEHQVAHFASEGIGNLKGRIAQAFTVAAIEEFIRRTIESVAEIKHQSEQFGITTDEVQRMTVAANRAGLEFESIGRALIRFGAIRKEAGVHEGGEDTKLLEKYKISLEDIRNPMLTNLDLMLKIGEAMKDIKITPEVREDFDKMFGSKQGERLLAVIKELHEMPPIILVPPSQIEALNNLSKDAEELWRIAKAIGALAITAEMQSVESSPGWKAIQKMPDMLLAIFNAAIKAAQALGVLAKAPPTSWADHIQRDDTNVLPPNPKGNNPPPKPPTIFDYKPDKSLVEELDRAKRETLEVGMTREQKRKLLLEDQSKLQEKMKTDRGDDLLKDQIKNQHIERELKELNIGHGKGLEALTGGSGVRTGNFLGATGAGRIVSIGEQTNAWLARIHQAIVSPKSGKGTLTRTGPEGTTSWSATS